jgi:hypothetical protein
MVDVHDTRWHGRLVHLGTVVEIMKHYGVIKVPLVQTLICRLIQ